MAFSPDKELLVWLLVLGAVGVIHYVEPLIARFGSNRRKRHGNKKGIYKESIDKIGRRKESGETSGLE